MVFSPPPPAAAAPPLRVRPCDNVTQNHQPVCVRRVYFCVPVLEIKSVMLTKVQFVCSIRSPFTTRKEWQKISKSPKLHFLHFGPYDARAVCTRQNFEYNTCVRRSCKTVHCRNRAKPCISENRTFCVKRHLLRAGLNMADNHMVSEV